MKKIASIMLIILILLNCFTPLTLAFGADTEFPKINTDTLNVDKKEATVGDTITISIEVTDNIGIDDVTIWYQTPITKKNKYVYLNYNSNTNKYEGRINIDDSYEEGIWKIDYIYAKDISSNTTHIYNSKISSFNPASDLSSGNFTITNTNADTEFPKINTDTLSIDKKEATVGDTITISIEVTDNVGMDSVTIWYQTPITKKNKYVYLNYNSNTNKYEGRINIDDSYEEGIWKIDYIYAKDISSNTISIHNSKISLFNPASDLSSGNFTITNTNADTEFPKINTDTLSIDKKEATVGDTITISIEVTDNVGIDSVSIYYQAPITKKNQAVYLNYNSNTNKYEGRINIDDSYEEGIWKIYYIYAKDTSSNTISIHNSKISLFNPVSDLSSGNFTISIDEELKELYKELESIQPIEGVTIYTSNRNISNKVINGDIYIGPKAVVTLSNVTVNGNIYVLGGARLINIRTNGIYARSISTGYGTTFYNGTVYISGNCYIPSSTCRTYPVETIPFEIDSNSIQINDGILQMKGATLDIADFYINDRKIDISQEGKFIIKDLEVGDSNTITLKWTTIFGNTIKKIYAIKTIDGDINNDGKVNARDAKLVLQYFNGQTTLTAEEQARADVNGDGKINARDAKLILQIFNGK